VFDRSKSGVNNVSSNQQDLVEDLSRVEGDNVIKSERQLVSEYKTKGGLIKHKLTRNDENKFDQELQFTKEVDFHH